MKHSTLLLKFIVILCLFISPVLLYGQNVPVIETDIVRSFRFTDKQLALETEHSELMKKYENECYDDDLSKNIPKKDRERIEYLSGKLENADDEIYVWNTQYPGCSWYCGGFHFQTASSSLPNKGNNIYDASRIFDNDVRTAWVEGVKGYGIGEYIDVHFPRSGPQATDCYIVNGYNKNETTWRNNSRVKSMNLYLNEKLVAILNLKDTRDEQHFVLPDTIPNYSYAGGSKEIEWEGEKYTVSTLRFLITDVYRGDKYDDTAISELYFDGIGVHCIAEGAKVAMSDRTECLIQDIKKGDEILVYNTSTDTFEGREVKTIHKVNHSVLYNVLLANGKSITVTDDHPFWNGKGWCSIHPVQTKKYPRYKNLEVGELNEGSNVMTKDGLVIIKSIEKETKGQNTYTFELDDHYPFVVNGFLVGQE